jgi:hypothetical protein
MDRPVNPFPFVRALRGWGPRYPAANTQANTWDSSRKRPVAVRRSTLGCMGETGSSQGTHPHLLPPVLIKLLNDLTRLERAVGLMTHNRAGLTTRNP